MDLPEDAAAGLEAEAVDGLGFWPEADTRRIVAELRLDRGIVRCAGLNP